MTNRRFLFAAATLLAGGSLLAQNLLSYRPTGAAGTARMFEHPCLSRAWDGVAGPGLIPGSYPGRVRRVGSSKAVPATPEPTPPRSRRREPPSTRPRLPA